MSQSGSPGLHPTHDTTAGGVCPYLGRCDDAENYFSFPTVSNCCHTRRRPFSIEPSYQANVCLEGTWTSCPRYEDAKHGGVARRLPIWALIGIALAAIILIGSLLVFLGPLLRGGTPTPTSAAGPGLSTLSPTTELASPTATNTPAVLLPARAFVAFSQR